jgi:hypothetical protein
MTDTKRLRERTDVLSFFINILILERGSGMKSYSNFIIEKKRGTAVASPAPGDPLDPKGRKKIEKKFSDPSNPPKVENPEAPKSKPTPKPEGVKQADVSKKAANYRRAERVKGATGGKTTGSLSKGTLSFPGDRSGAYQKTKSDLEARKGFSGSKSGGLKADESNPNVNRSVRQQRTVKQGTPDPFDPKAPKAPARPFKGLTKGKKSSPTSIPDPFKSATTKPKTAPKPKAPSGPGPAMSQAIKDIKQAMSRRGVKTTEADVAQRYMRTMQDTGRPVDPDFVAAQGPKASSAKPEMVGGSTAPTGTGARMRAKGDAIRDINKAKNADLDKAFKNLVSSGDVKTSKPSGPSSSIGFRQASKKFSEITKQTKAAQARSAAAGYSKSNKPKAGSQVVKVPTKPTGVRGASAGDITLKGPSKGTPKFSSKSTGSDLAKKSFGKFSIDSGRTGGLSKTSNIIDVDVKDLGPTKQPALPGTAKSPKAPKPSSVKLPPARKTPALAAAAKNAPVTKGMLKQMGGRALGLAGSAYDAVSSYQEYKKRGDSNLRAGVKSAFRTGLGYAGGALGGLAGAIGGGGIGSAVTGTAGAIGGYSAGTWLADKILGATRYERKKRAREKAAAKAAANQK